MTVRAVEKAIRDARRVMQEWEQVAEAYWPGENSWKEDQTRYAIIDPIIRALGWDTSDPKECHPEYPRPFGGRRVDYALFREGELADIGSGNAVPEIIVEAKKVGADLDHGLTQLQRYVRAKPSMKEGVAVLTNGREWRFYSVEGRKNLSVERGDTVDILCGNLRQISQTLNLWIKKTPRP